MKFGHFNDRGLPDNLSNLPADKDLYTVNSYGYRCPEWDPMPDGKKNVVVLGCSHTFGQGNAEDEHWVHHVSQHNTQRLRYWNLGQPGASGDRIVRTLYGSEKLIDPRVIIVCWPDWSRRERLEAHTTNIPGSDETLRFENNETDLNNFLRNVFFVEKYAERKGCTTFHCFAQDSYYEHLHGLNALQDTLKNCWPYFDNHHLPDAHREFMNEVSLARDGYHCGIEHHKRFSQLFLDKFGPRLK